MGSKLRFNVSKSRSPAAAGAIRQFPAAILICDHIVAPEKYRVEGTAQHGEGGRIVAHPTETSSTLKANDRHKNLMRRGTSSGHS